MFNEVCYKFFTSHNKTFCLVCIGDDLLTKLIPSEVKLLGIRLPQHFFQFFDILYEFKCCYPHSEAVESTADMLRYLNLKQISCQNQCSLETKNVVRIINKLIKDNHTFTSPKLLNQTHELIRAVREVPGNRKNNQYRRWSGFIRGRSPEPYKLQKDYYARVRGLPVRINSEGIVKKFKAIRLKESNVAMLYDTQGDFTSEAVLKLMNDRDFKELLSYHLGESGKSVIEVYEARAEDFELAQKSVNPDSRVNTPVPMFQEGSKCILIKNLPDSSKELDIKLFVGNLRLVNRGIYWGFSNSNKRSSEVLITVDSQKAVDLLVNKDRTDLGGDDVQVEEIQEEGVKVYFKNNFIKKDTDEYITRCFSFLPLDMRSRTLIMYSLPLDTTIEDLYRIFSKNNVSENGIRLMRDNVEGAAAIIFEDEVDARRALKTKSLIYLKSRYVEVHEMR